jgi:predicted kinase
MRWRRAVIWKQLAVFSFHAGSILVAIGGLSGTGKSSFAAALAASIGRAPGAVQLRSDIERKRLFIVRELDCLPEEAYWPGNSARTYERLRDLASTALDAGQSVVIDAVHLRLEERRAVKRAASRRKAHFTGLWLEAPVNMLMERIAKRKNDASDATADVVSAQAKQPTGAVDWLRVDASSPVESIVSRALAAILG